MKTKHTPGPWKQSDRAKFCILSTKPPRHTICVMQNHHREDWLPNAKLIAAAPDLLDACYSMLNIEKAAIIGKELSRALDGLNVKYYYDKVRSAIKKTTELEGS